jgi:DNA gyrase subunit A
VFGTRNGTVKRTKLSAFDSPRSTLIAINLVEGDELIAVRASDGDQTVVMVSSNGKAIRFLESDARAMGRNSTGVRGMRLQGDAKVLSMGLALTPGEVPAELRAVEESASAVLKEAELLFAEQAAAIDDELEIPAELRSLRQRAQLAGDAVLDIVNPDRLSVLTVTQTGKGKRTGVEAYKVQGRGGQGIGTHDLKNTAKTGGLAGALIVPEDAEVMMFTDSGTIIRTPLEDVRMAGRSTQGVSMMRTGEDVKVVGLALVVDDVVDEELLEEGAEPTNDVTEATATTADPTSNHAGSDAASESADTSNSDED